MAQPPLDELLLDLLEWIAKRERTYADVMDAWRTSCPKLPIWEEAVDRGMVQRKKENGNGAMVSLTSAGREFLEQRRR
jgi:predicted transcriptional regulator